MPNGPEILCSAKALKTFGSLEQLQPPAVTFNFVSGSPENVTLNEKKKTVYILSYNNYNHNNNY